MTDRLLSTDDAVQWLRERGRKTSADTLRKAMEAGEFGRRLGRNWLISEAELRRWLGFEPLVILDDQPPALPTVTRFVARRRSA